MPLIERAAGRYKDLIPMLAASSCPELSTAALQQVIERANGNAGHMLAEHIAANTPLTADQVEPQVNAALAAVPPGAGSAVKAEATKQVVNDLVPKVNVELTEAVMLSGPVRAAFAGVFTLIFVGGIVAIMGVGKESSPSETTLVALVVVTVLALIVSLVLIMGYKSVKAKLEPASA